MVYHQKANGKLAPKVFKWKELEIAPSESVTLTKKHAFVAITTRKYYQGEHAFAVQLNGVEQPKLTFNLNMS